jgi:hypothetical protein
MPEGKGSEPAGARLDFAKEEVLRLAAGCKEHFKEG